MNKFISSHSPLLFRKLLVIEPFIFVLFLYMTILPPSAQPCQAPADSMKNPRQNGDFNTTIKIRFV
ncbi:MAG: hypothetical protein WAW91_01600 [Candidatus Nanoperiomorbaceae bacterium]